MALLVDEGTWCPLNSLYNPEHNKNGSTSIVKGLGRVNGKWCCIIASDNKKHAGTWVPGQADNLLRGSDTAKRLRIPLSELHYAVSREEGHEGKLVIDPQSLQNAISLRISDIKYSPMGPVPEIDKPAEP